jgi:catechol 2,3-dioxygenase-like lactoylglutathione lyase family enzyme
VKVSRIQHIGIPVSNLERSQKWYVEQLGLITGEPIVAGGEATSRAVQVDDVQIKAVFLGVGDHTQVELLEYTSPVGKPFELRNCDIGAVHICFEVDDIQAAYDELVANGVVFNAPPAYIDEGLLAGVTFAYFRDPDNIQLEIFEMPKQDS